MELGYVAILTLLLSTFFSLGLQWTSQVKVAEWPFGFHIFLAIIATGLFFFDLKKRWPSLSSREVVETISSADNAKSEQSMFTKHKPLLNLTWGVLATVFLPIVFHLAGIPVGREGVGIQIGGFSALIIALLAGRARPSWEMFAVGISVGFSTIFGAPLAALAFVFESSACRNLKVFLLLLACNIIGAFSGVWFGVQHRPTLSVTSSLTTKSLPLSIILFSIITILAAVTYSKFIQSVGKIKVRLIALESKMHIGAELSLFILLSVITLILSLSPFGWGIKSLGLPFLNPSNYTQVWSLGSAEAFVSVAIKFILLILYVGLGYRGGEVTPLLSISTVLANSFNVFGQSSAMACAVLWGVIAKRPLTAALLGFELTDVFSETQKQVSLGRYLEAIEKTALVFAIYVLIRFILVLMKKSLPNLVGIYGDSASKC